MCASKLMLCRAHTGWSWVKCSLVAEVAVIRSREASPARDAAKIVFPNEQNHFSRTSFNEVFISRLLDSTKGLIFCKFQTFLLSPDFSLYSFDEKVSLKKGKGAGNGVSSTKAQNRTFCPRNRPKRGKHLNELQR